MRRLIMISILLGTIALISSCTKKCWIYYDLEIPVTITTNADTINIGDTISINMKFDKNVYDLNSNQHITIENFDFNQGLEIYRIEDSIVTPVWTEYFDFVEDIGEIEYNGIKLVYDGSYYEFKHHFIAKEKGIYSFGIGFSSMLSGGRRYEVDFQEGKCKEELVEQTIEINKQSDGTFDTNWEIAADNTSHEATENLKRTTYTFVVE